MKQKFISGISLGAIALLLCVGCNKQNDPAVQVKKNGLPQNVDAQPGQIAFVEIDSIMTQYQFCKDYTAILKEKSESYKSQITSKGQALENAAMNFQQKVQQGAYASQEEAMKVQSSLQRQQESFQKLQEDLSAKFEEEQAKFNQALRDSVHNFLEEYNKQRKFSLILSKSGDNILYADKGMNITNEVIAGLNKRYKKK